MVTGDLTSELRLLVRLVTAAVLAAFLDWDRE
jgi:hypothetical protein